MSWIKKVGCLGFVNLMKAIKAPFTKWILHALELGNPIYNVYLDTNYVNISLTKMGSGHILSYGAYNHKIKGFPKSSICNWIGRAWTKMVRQVMEQNLITVVDMLTTNFYWNKFTQLCKDDFSRKIVVEIFSLGWKTIYNIWVTKEGRFASKEEMRNEFSLSAKEELAYDIIASTQKQMIGKSITGLRWVMLGYSMGRNV